MLIDEISAGFGPHRDSFLMWCDKSVLVNIQPVVDYYFFGTDQEIWDYGEDGDFPNMAPPWPSALYFWRFPKEVISEEKGRYAHPLAGKAVAVAIAGMKRKTAPGWVVCSICILPEVAKVGRAPVVMFVGGVLNPDGSMAKRGEEGAVEEAIALVDAYRRVFSAASGGGVSIPPTKDSGGRYALAVAIPQYDEAPVGEVAGMWQAQFLYPSFLATSFCHCKNTTVDDAPMDAALRKARRAEGKASGLLRWKTLTIEPMGKILRQTMKEHGVGARKALHICRGHFKEYKERGLFGKYHGMFWWEMHARGSKERGEVVKSYKVKPDEGAA